MKKPSAAELLRKRSLVAAQISGRTEASSTSLSRSFGLELEDVKRILRSSGVNDNG